MIPHPVWVLAVSLSAFTALTAVAATPTVPQGDRTRGAKVVLERVVRSGEPTQVVAQRARLLSLAVERGETASPFLEPGPFKATFHAVVTLLGAGYYRFRVDGRGTVRLALDGAAVLEGHVLPGAAVESAQAVRLRQGENELLLEFESAATGEGQLRLLWQPPGAGFEPIAPELLSWATADADIAAGERLRDGHRLFAIRRCARCHAFEELRFGESAFGELAIAGPDLRSVGGRLQRDWLSAWLLAPRSLRHGTAMPAFGLSTREADDLAAWLDGLGAPIDLTFPAGAVAAGRVRYRELGCAGCHVAPEEPPDAVGLGDRLPLQPIAHKWYPGALVEYLQAPARYHADVRMPDYRLSREDAVRLAAYVAADTGEPLRAAKGNAARGRRVAQKKLCAACHELDVPLDDRIAPNLRNLKLDRGCLAENPRRRGGAPDHELTEEDRTALRAFLPFAEVAPFRRAPLDFARRQIEVQRCTGCHALDGAPSVWAQATQRLAEDAPLPPEQDPVAQGVPSLTWVGARLQPSWIARFVTGREASPRPWLRARMPAYSYHGEGVAQGLVREHGYGAEDEPPIAPNAALAAHGGALLRTGTGLGCVQCHAFGDQAAEQVLEREGIELGVARGRMRHEFYLRWLLDPPRLDAEARMPRFGDEDGRTAVTGILDGKAVEQFEAIWHWLGSRR